VRRRATCPLSPAYKVTTFTILHQFLCMSRLIQELDYYNFPELITWRAGQQINPCQPSIAHMSWGVAVPYRAAPVQADKLSPIWEPEPGMESPFLRASSCLVNVILPRQTGSHLGNTYAIYESGTVRTPHPRLIVRDMDLFCARDYSLFRNNFYRFLCCWLNYCAGACCSGISASCSDKGAVLLITTSALWI
jgi:hypothetical protein